MAKTNNYSVALAPSAAAANTTKSAPAKTSATINLQPNYGTGITVAITNGASAPGSPPQAQIQVSGDDATWRDYGVPLVGDSTSNSVNSWAVDIAKHWMYARVIFFGHTTNPVTVSVEAQAATGL